MTTSIDYLIEHLTAIGVLEVPEGNNAVTHAIRNAKALHRNEIINAHGVKTTHGVGYFEQKTGEDYYNETFKTQI